jgi:hypothetical protein
MPEHKIQGQYIAIYLTSLAIEKIKARLGESEFTVEQIENEIKRVRGYK